MELLAVGLLMAIAIPSITRYIIQSRRKTVVSSIDGYVSFVVNSVNDQDYKFTEANKIYAVPIECIPLEKGETNPFGKWLQANKDYWAYVLVQYDSENFSYTYGFTFKDSAGYGMYPTAQREINPKSTTQIKTGLELTKPTSGKITNITEVANWSGFDVDSETNLVVLEAESEGTPGNGETTCTLCQKGSNYDEVEKEKENDNDDVDSEEQSLPDNALSVLIKKHNTLITSSPTLTTRFDDTSDVVGLYVSTDTNTGKETYYFRGTGSINNYVEFAGLEWRIIRINEDGTVRLILSDSINNSNYAFHSTDKYNNYSGMYYSNSDTAKPTVDNWYKTNIVNLGYDSYVSIGMFCEQAKVNEADVVLGNATMEYYKDYIPNFKCTTDGNGKGILSSKVGLITYDEIIYAGGHHTKGGQMNFYLDNGDYFYTMSPGGLNNPYTKICGFNSSILVRFAASDDGSLRPVINLKADVLASGTGAKKDPYVVPPIYLSSAIKRDNNVITAEPMLTTSSNNTTDESGLYMSNVTNSGNSTYYFRGNVTNNYVSFAGLTWRIIRINEDGTVRLILNDRIGTTYNFNTVASDYTHMYYSNSDTAKPTLDSWYQENIVAKGYDSYVSDGMFCEQAKVKYTSSYTGGNATMAMYNEYTPTFKCTTDGNGKGIVKNEDGTLVKVGLINMDEVVFAGGYYGKSNSAYYLKSSGYVWTMSASGAFGNAITRVTPTTTNSYVFNISTAGAPTNRSVKLTGNLRPVINLNADVLVNKTGTGDVDSPYVVITE